MPFQSKSQQRFMFARHPKIAKEWAAETPDINALPENVMDRKRKAKRRAIEGLIAKYSK